MVFGFVELDVIQIHTDNIVAGSGSESSELSATDWGALTIELVARRRREDARFGHGGLRAVNSDDFWCDADRSFSG